MSETPEWRELPYPLWQKLLMFVTAPVVVGGSAMAVAYATAHIIDWLWLAAEQFGATL